MQKAHRAPDGFVAHLQQPCRAGPVQLLPPLQDPASAATARAPRHKHRVSPCTEVLPQTPEALGRQGRGTREKEPRHGGEGIRVQEQEGDILGVKERNEAFSFYFSVKHCPWVFFLLSRFLQVPDSESG